LGRGDPRCRDGWDCDRASGNAAGSGLPRNDIQGFKVDRPLGPLSEGVDPSFSPASLVHLSPIKFLAGCVVAAASVLAAGRFMALPTWLLAVEVLVTVVALFMFGSIRYRLDKNALTYGAGFLITATFWSIWWPSSGLRASVQAEGGLAVWRFARHHVLSFRGLDHLVHADTMLFILGLTFFVAVIAQTRLLETASFAVLNWVRGNVAITVAALTGIVSFASGILDGVSMIGLMIRTLVIILLLSRAEKAAVLYAVVLSTVVTTVCGMWLAYGEPPNLIMKANLYPHLTNSYFLRYCLPIAFGSYLIVLWNVRRRLRGRRVEMASLDVLDLHTADVRFLQAERHGEVLLPVEFVEEHRDALGSKADAVIRRLRNEEPLGAALAAEGIPEHRRRQLLGAFVSEDLAEPLDAHYQATHGGKQGRDASLTDIQEKLEQVRRRRIQAQRVGGLSFIPFIGLLAWHAVDHDVPLFWASFAGFAVAFLGIVSLKNTRTLALREARHEYAEYLFLLPLFLSITLLQKAGFFDQLSALLRQGVETLGASHLAGVQLAGATLLSALLDNNVVADFAGRALNGLPVNLIHLFATAQIAGYALGGCWTHIGSAQSVVAYAFIRKDLDAHFTPAQWIKLMTPVVLEIGAFMFVMIYLEGWLLK
jgi:Na+/H+ antiporter NhaD/arsenite permease-like protein